MKVCVLASGSKGNSVYVETLNHKLLIDLGTSSIQVEKNLKEINVDPKTIDSIFITHTHVDHIAGLRVFTKKYKPTVYLKEEMYSELENMIIGDYRFLEKELFLEDLKVELIKTSHDAVASTGYIFEENGKSLVYMTDTGYISEKNLKKLKGKTIYIMESNHDVEMLMNSPYPYSIKQRIRGVNGHLSNENSAYYISSIADENTKKVILAHLSEENNTEDKALQTYHEVLKKHGKENLPIIVAQQKEKTEIIEV